MLRSTFSGFTTAQLALSASQRALDVTGQNLANVNTSGYTRQRLDLASISPVGASFSNSPNDCKVGMGVMMTGITQIRNPFLDLQYRNQLAKTGTADAKDQILTQLGNIFDETTNEGIRKALSDVITQLNNLGKTESAATDSADALVRSAMGVLVTLMHDKSSAIGEVKDDLLNKLTNTTTKDINQTIKSIVELNESIKSSQVLGSPALELMDQRNALIDELATYLPIDVQYKEQNVGGGVMVDTLQVTFKDTNGVEHSLISDNKGATFNFSTTPGTGVPVSMTITDALDPTNPAKGGEISDAIGNGILKGEFDMLNKSEVFDGSGVKGIDYYGKMFDAFVEKFATVLNDLNTVYESDGVTIKSGGPLFTTKDGNTTGFTAENIKVSDKWMNGEVKILLTTNDSPGGTPNGTAYENVQKMINAISKDKQDYTVKVKINGVEQDVKVFEGIMFDAYDNIQSTVGNEAKSVKSILKNNITVLNQIADSKDSVSGVYLDEEVMSLMRYQQSYNAAARLMTTLDEALNTLINNTGVVGR